MLNCLARSRSVPPPSLTLSPSLLLYLSRYLSLSPSLPPLFPFLPLFFYSIPFYLSPSLCLFTFLPLAPCSFFSHPLSLSHFLPLSLSISFHEFSLWIKLINLSYYYFYCYYSIIESHPPT